MKDAGHSRMEIRRSIGQMKDWVKKAGGVLFAALLTVMLNGKAYAEDETQPQDVAVEIPEPVPAMPAPADPVAVVSAMSVSSEPAVSDGAAESSAPAAGTPAAEAPAAAAGTPVAEGPAVSTETPVPDAPAAATETFAAEVPADLAGTQANEKNAPAALPEAPAAETNMVVAEPSSKEIQTIQAADSETQDKENNPDGQKPILKTVNLEEQTTAQDMVVPDSDLPATGIAALRKGRSLATAAPLLSAENSADSSETTPASTDGENGNSDVELTKGEDNTGETGDTSGNNPIYIADDGSYILVNHKGTENLSADGDIAIQAAGLNRISSISGTGRVQITGTGILLVDRLEGNLEFHTFTDVYDSDPYQSGSVAVFVKQDDGTYLLSNGSVPGLLDEEYKIEGVTLVMPAQTSLLLFGTGAKPTVETVNDHENVTSVEYYHGPEHSCTTDWSEAGTEERNRIVESTGKLTITQSAELIVRQGASVVMESLWSLKKQYSSLYPELHTTDGGKLTVEGSVSGDGVVEFEADSGAVSGSGTITAERIIADSPVPISDSGVRFSSRNLMLRGSGEVKNLKIDKSSVYPETNAIVITGLDSTGGTDSEPTIDSDKSVIVLPNSSTLDISKVVGELYLRQRKYYQSVPLNDYIVSDEMEGASEYNDEYAHTISGAISGNGTIVFSSGIFKLSDGTTADGVAFSENGGGLVYNYAGDGVMSNSESPLHMQPSNAVRADSAGNGGKIAIKAAVLEEHNNVLTAGTLDEFQDLRKGVKTVTVVDGIALKDLSDQTILSLVAANNGENWTLSLDNLKAIVQKNMPVKTDGIYGSSLPCAVVVEFLRKSGDTLSTEFYSVDSLTGSVTANDVCLIRVSYVYNKETVSPGGTATQTGTLYTGSGILGGSGAGTVYTEDSGHDDTSGSGGGDDSGSDHTGGDDSGNDNTGGNENGNTGNNTEDPEPVPLAAYIEDTQETALVWVEVAPVVSAETEDSAEDADSAETAAPADTTYVLLALEGEKTLEDLGGKAAVSMSYTPPAEYEGKTLYVVFRDENNKLVAFRATYSDTEHLLRFITQRRQDEKEISGFRMNAAPDK